MPLRHRHEYAADLPRGLQDGSCLPSPELPAHTLDEIRTAPGPHPPGSSRCLIKGMSHAGSSRTPLRPARRTQTIWQYWPVPALSGLLTALTGTTRIRLPPASLFHCGDRLSVCP